MAVAAAMYLPMNSSPEPAVRAICLIASIRIASAAIMGCNLPTEGRFSPLFRAIPPRLRCSIQSIRPTIQVAAELTSTVPMPV